MSVSVPTLVFTPSVPCWHMAAEAGAQVDMAGRNKTSRDQQVLEPAVSILYRLGFLCLCNPGCFSVSHHTAAFVAESRNNWAWVPQLE